MTDTPTIPQLQARVDNARAELRRQEQQLRDAQLTAAEYKVGDVVESLRPGSRQRPAAWAPAIIVEVIPHSYGVEYKVAYRRKNGEWSASSEHAYRLRPAAT